MQKFKPVTLFIGVHQHESLLSLANATRGINSHVKDESVSSLTRLAVTCFLRDLEEWDDARKWNAATKVAAR